jgi:hypothetical protein
MRPWEWARVDVERWTELVAAANAWHEGQKSAEAEVAPPKAPGGRMHA